MAMIDPPIEALIDKAGGKYDLVEVVAHRAKKLLLEKPEFFAENIAIKPIEVASEEFYENKIEKVKRQTRPVTNA